MNNSMTTKEKLNEESGTLCWQCDKARGNGCSWHRLFVPVKGWSAIEATLRFRGRPEKNGSYLVTSCPEFEPNKRKGELCA